MKKTIRIIIPIILALAIVLCLAWYLFVYDREFTRDMLLTCARYYESNGNNGIATWLYEQAYSHANDNDAVAIELSEQYKANGNYTKAEFTLSNAIADGGGIELYIALCKTYVEQDKLLDAVNMLNSVTNERVRFHLDRMRPKAPEISPDPGFYNQYISVSVQAESGTLYVTADGKYPSVKDTPYRDAIQLTGGENTVYAIAVSESGLVSPISVFGYTIGGVIEPVEFSDSAIEKAIREILKVNADEIVYTDALWTIKSFTVPSEAEDYTDLARLSYLESLTIENGKSSQLQYVATLSNLTELKIKDTSVSQEDLSAIASIPVLEKLTLNNCSLSNISVLSAAEHLKILDLSNNTIRNIEPIAQLLELTEVNLQHNAIVNLVDLSPLHNMTKLDLSYNSIAFIEPLCSATTLTWLDLSSNKISALSDMSRLTSLTYLSLSNNTLTDVSAISSCKTLTTLNISNNTISKIDKLTDLTELMHLDFSYNKITTIPTWPKNCALVSIDGSHNSISSLKSLAGLKHLNNIYMDYNTEISSVDALVDCPLLVQVNVYGTKVKSAKKLTHTSDGKDRGIIVNYDPT